MADIEKVIGQLTNLDERIKLKEAEVKDLKNKKMELQSKWINDLMSKNSMSFEDLASLVSEKKSSQNEITTEDETSESNAAAQTSDSTNVNYQNKHN